jgi:hypothetical protein
MYPGVLRKPENLWGTGRRFWGALKGVSSRLVQEPRGSLPSLLNLPHNGGRFSIFSGEVVRKLRFSNNAIVPAA